MDIHLEHNHSRMSEKLLATFYKVETTHWWWAGRKTIVMSILGKYLKKGEAVILDGGCGTGSNILFLKKFGDVHGVDISSIATKFCKKRGIKKIKKADISKLPYKNSFFDAVCLMDVLEHIKNEQLVIKEIYRVLKPQGILLLTVPALPFIFSGHDKKQGHFRRYTKTYLKKIFKNSQFNEMKTSYFNSLLSAPIVVVRLLSKIKYFSKLADFDAKLNYDIHKINFLNAILSKIFSFESNILEHSNLPFGVSIIALYKKELKIARVKEVLKIYPK